jgi:hypothetical protein
MQSLLPARKPAVNGCSQAGIATANSSTPQVNANYCRIGLGDMCPEIQRSTFAGANLKHSFRI